MMIENFNKFLWRHKTIASSF